MRLDHAHTLYEDVVDALLHLYHRFVPVSLRDVVQDRLVAAFAPLVVAQAISLDKVLRFFIDRVIR
jgi:hypothetical protein